MSTPDKIIWKGSPNFDTSRKTVDRIVLHWFGGGSIDSANSRFQNSANKVSAHFGISEHTIYQWVDTKNVAYHAGNYAMNQRSIGIEHHADPSFNATEETYQNSIALVRDLCLQYNIPIDRQHIIKHSEVPHATQCCGTLDIDRIVREAAKTPQTGASMDPSVQALLTKYGADSIATLDAKINEAVGTTWGAESLPGGGFLADSRRQLTKIKDTLQTQLEFERSLDYQAGLADGKLAAEQSKDITNEITVAGSKWILNGVNLIDGKIQGNYKKA